MTDKLWSAQYWADELAKEVERAEPLLKTLWQVPSPELTIEERIKLRYILAEIRSISTLLSRDMAEPDPPKPSLLKRLLRR